MGLAIRNLREESLHKGCIITHPESKVMVKHNISSFTLNKAPFQEKQIKKDDIIHASTDLQFIVGRVSNIKQDQYQIHWESPLWIRSQQNTEIILTQLDAKPMRILGTAKILKSE